MFIQIIKGMLHFYYFDAHDIRISTVQMFGHLAVKPIPVSPEVRIFIL